jgi:hypothetical protein
MPLFDQMQLCQESAMKVLVVLGPQGVNHQQEFGEGIFQETRDFMVLAGFLGKALVAMLQSFPSNRGKVTKKEMAPSNVLLCCKESMVNSGQ